MANTLRKSERLHRKKIIEQMFAGGSRSFSLFPIRVVYMETDRLDVPVSLLISVSKRRFKRAVKRNRVKRQLREAFRRNKQFLSERVQAENKQIVLAFIYLSDKLSDSHLLEERMQTALIRIAEHFSPATGNPPE